jgi:hypothetical protein
MTVAELSLDADLVSIDVRVVYIALDGRKRHVKGDLV